MKNLGSISIDWIETRTGLSTAVRQFLFDEIPGSAGWPHVFGSVALFLFLIQAFSGILLAFNYAPTPGEAYNSVTYIMHEVTAGKMIRGLHHWGASAMVIVVVTHMVQVFVYGSYKKPRETTWMVGVLLLLFTFGFGLTGYLLPWDNRAYWGTMVTAHLMQQVPLMGHQLAGLIGAADGIGAVTFSRFYTLHTTILPALMTFLILMHVYLVRRHGVTPSPVDNAPKQRFYPAQVYRDVVAVFVAFGVVFLLAAFVDAPLQGLADPTDATYVPRPEWYFLFLFQALKYFHGALEPVGSIGLPTLVLLALFAVPFIDRGQVRRVTQRTAAIGIVLLISAGWSALTAEAIAGTPSKTASAGGSAFQEFTRVSTQELAGIGYFRQDHCASCHNLFEGEPKAGPNLAALANHKSTEWMVEHFKSHSGSAALTIPERRALSALAMEITPEGARLLEKAPPTIVEGAQVYVTNGCGSCHKVNRTGGALGPSLNGLASRRSKEWIAKHFEAPAALSPGSIMPPFQFNNEDQRALVSYLTALPE